MVFSNNRYSHYNFQVVVPHDENICQRDSAVVIVRRRLERQLLRYMEIIPADSVDTNMSTAAIYRRFSGQCAESHDQVIREAIALHLPENLIHNMQRHRNNNPHQNPVLPQHVVTWTADTIPVRFTMSKEAVEADRENILLRVAHPVVGTKIHTIMIFGRKKLLLRLLSASTPFIDGTFLTCPPNFYQVMMLHFDVRGYTFTGMYAVMTGKGKELVRYVLDSALDIARNYTMVDAQLLMGIGEVDQHQPLQPVEVVPATQLIKWETTMSDFELAIVNSLKEFAAENHLLFTVHSCLFHFCQLILKKAKTCGLSQYFDKENHAVVGHDLLVFMRTIMALPHLPLHDTIDPNNQQLISNMTSIFRECVAELRVKLVGHADEAGITVVLNKFIQYCEIYWMDETDAHCVPQTQMNVSTLGGVFTNNKSEGKHNKARLAFGPHPPMLNWITTVRDMLRDDTLLMQQLDNNPTAQKLPENNNKLMTMGLEWTRLVNGEVTEREFVNGLAKRVNLNRYRNPDHDDDEHLQE